LQNSDGVIPYKSAEYRCDL